MRPAIEIIVYILGLYQDIIIISAIFSWLIAFNVVNVRNDIVRSIWNTLLALTEPALMRIRRFLPATGGLDLSPIVLYFLVEFIRQVLMRYIYPYVP